MLRIEPLAPSLPLWVTVRAEKAKMLPFFEKESFKWNLVLLEKTVQ